MNKREYGASQVDAILTALAGLHITALCVEVMEGSVYLGGVAGSYDQKRHAAEIAESFFPEMLVQNEIRVAQASFCDDADVAEAVSAAIGAQIGEDAASRVTVRGDGGMIRLDGMAMSRTERSLIEAAAWEASRSTRVESHIALSAPDVADGDVAVALTAYVERSLNIPAGAVSVGYAGGVATLSGAVASPTQARAIEDLVRWHDRVEDVVNGLHVIAPEAVARSARTAL